MASPLQKIGLFYDDSAYVEPAQVRPNAPLNAAQGLMGRHVAGKEFLDAYWSFGDWKELVALVNKSASAQSIRAYSQSHPVSRFQERHLQIVEEQNFHRTFFPHPPTTWLLDTADAA
ncbi:MAG: hypothetical protein IRY99_23010, partial [Isosphaeraceae bacterium]|nr:hypothetical protein [Isosphaeraceae bacterium]